MRKAVVRTDSKEVLGVVGNSYQPIQNHQCFGFLDSVVADGQINYHTAGALGSGERIWMLAKLPKTIRITGSDDITEQFLLLSNSHNGGSSLRVFFTPIRVVCANTLGAAERRGRKQGVSIHHRGDLNVAKVGEAQKILGLASRFYDDLESKINHLANVSLTNAQLESYFKQLYPDPIETKSNRTKNVRAELTRLFEEGLGQDIPQIRHSAWAAFNAVTEYIDHHRSTRGKSESDIRSNRLKSAWFGSGAQMKCRAWDLAMDLAS
jgi:phage/plasmid-like protein (TIGR03299 family)